MDSHWRIWSELIRRSKLLYSLQAAEVISVHCSYKMTVILIICFDSFKGIINSNYLLLNDILKRNEFPFNNSNYAKTYILSRRVLEVHECCVEPSLSFCISPSPVIKISWLTYGIFFTSFQKKNINTEWERVFPLVWSWSSTMQEQFRRWQYKKGIQRCCWLLLRSNFFLESEIDTNCSVKVTEIKYIAVTKMFNIWNSPKLL